MALNVFYDVVINNLPTFKDIKNSFRYITKEWELYDEELRKKAVFTCFSNVNFDPQQLLIEHIINNQGHNKKKGELPFPTFFITNISLDTLNYYPNHLKTYVKPTGKYH